MFQSFSGSFVIQYFIYHSILTFNHHSIISVFSFSNVTFKISIIQFPLGHPTILFPYSSTHSLSFIVRVSIQYFLSNLYHSIISSFNRHNLLHHLILQHSFRQLPLIACVSAYFAWKYHSVTDLSANVIQ